jgi:thioredoxin reductase (NADPH)
MADVIIIGDGPAGLSAALFLAKCGQNVDVFGKDETAMHAALLFNYLGIAEITGSEFQARARKQVEQQGARLHDAKIDRARKSDGGFEVTTEAGARHEAKYLILACGAKPPLAKALGAELDDKGFVVGDRNGRTSVPGLYVAGWSTRRDKIQAIISAGDGAACALDLLSAEKGKDFHDFDVPPGED